MRRLINATLTTNNQIHCFLVRCVIIIIAALQHNDSYTPHNEVNGDILEFIRPSVRPSVDTFQPSYSSVLLQLCWNFVCSLMTMGTCAPEISKRLASFWMSYGPFCIWNDAVLLLKSNTIMWKVAWLLLKLNTSMWKVAGLYTKPKTNACIRNSATGEPCKHNYYYMFCLTLYIFTDDNLVHGNVHETICTRVIRIMRRMTLLIKSCHMKF